MRGNTGLKACAPHRFPDLCSLRGDISIAANLTYYAKPKAARAYGASVCHRAGPFSPRLRKPGVPRTIAWLSLPSENDVFLRPDMRLAAMRAIQFVVLNFGLGPQVFPDCLPTGGEFCRRRAPD